MEFSNSLLYWYLHNKRDLPWRNTTNPYPIWISEIILQQTRVAQGTPYFLSFIQAFPTVFDLAKADEEQILKLWQGLGYYSRARNMHKAAQTIVFDFNGNFPKDYKELLKLKGIGEYTAAAIASFAYNEVVPVVDGNVFRVLSRYFDVETDIASGSAKKEFTALANELIPKDNPALFNQAIMEFGALQCVPKNPNCNNCIFKSSCAALQKKKVNKLPVKLNKTKVTKKYFNYLIFLDDSNSTVINKRIEKGIWHNLYDFPIIETESVIDFKTISEEIHKKYSNLEIKTIAVFNNEPFIHKLSHQKLHINFYKVEVSKKLKNGINLKLLRSYPFPVVIYNFIEKCI